MGQAQGDLLLGSRLLAVVDNLPSRSARHVDVRVQRDVELTNLTLHVLELRPGHQAPLDQGLLDRPVPAVVHPVRGIRAGREAELGSSKPSGPAVVLDVLALGPGRLQEEVTSLLLAGGQELGLPVTGDYIVRAVSGDDHASGRQLLNVQAVAVVHCGGLCVKTWEGESSQAVSRKP